MDVFLECEKINQFRINNYIYFSSNPISEANVALAKLSDENLLSAKFSSSKDDRSEKTEKHQTSRVVLRQLRVHM